MTHKINTMWKENLTFDAHIDKHVLSIDTVAPLGNDNGPSPKRLLLASLAGCTGMDVVALLKKMRVNFKAFDVVVEGDLTTEHPVVYSEFRVTYVITGENLNKDMVQKAVNLSRDKYCGVSAMLKKHSPIIYNIKYIED